MRNEKGKLKILNILLGINFVIVVSTALLRNYILPLGVYRQVHALPGFTLLLLVIMHLVLNKEWVKNTYFKHK